MRLRESPCSRRARTRRGLALCALLSSALLLCASRPASAGSPFNNPRWADRWEHLDPRPRNQLLIQAITLGNFAGVDLGYRRGLGRHFSLGGLLEYAYPHPGYGQLQGFG